MATRSIGIGIGIGGLLGLGCVADPLEGSRSAAEEGTRVEVMLVPLDEGASPGEGALAFDDGLPTTESLDDLADGEGAFVVGVVDGWGIALVPVGLTDEAGDAAAEALDGEVDSPEYDSADEPWQDTETDDVGSCASDCATWCSTVLDLCDGDGAEVCDCSGDAGWDDQPRDLPEEPEADACAADCDEWCTSSLDLCWGDGFAECDCWADDGSGYGSGDDDPGAASCAWDCEEWCGSSLELCDGDGWELCADSCDWEAASALPPSASAGGWVAPVVVAGVALVIVLTDPEVQAALDRGESIGNAVGGTYGRRADTIMARLRQLRGEIGQMADDARLPCRDLLTRRGYRERLDAAAGDEIRVGICMQDVLTVWPRDLTIRAGGRDSTRVSFSNLGSGFRTVTTRDATVGWTQAGEPRSLVVPEGSAASATLPLGQGSFGLTVSVPRDDSSTSLSVTVLR